MENKPQINIDSSLFLLRQFQTRKTCEQLARETGSSQSSITKLRQGDATIGLETAAKIAAALGLRVVVSFEPSGQSDLPRCGGVDATHDGCLKDQHPPQF